MNKLFNKKPIIKKDNNCYSFKFVACSIYSIKIISNFIFLKKWYQEKYCIYKIEFKIHFIFKKFIRILTYHIYIYIYFLNDELVVLYTNMNIVNA